MKNKNPLYVVKGKNVMEAKNLFDLLVKKFNLEPAMEIFTNLMKMMLAQVTSYSGFVAVKTWLDNLISSIFGVVTKYGMVKA
ncbi:MAG: hypothetical protein V4598_08120 [Bdellovibrionota bacterium]